MKKEKRGDGSNLFIKEKRSKKRTYIISQNRGSSTHIVLMHIYIDYCDNLKCTIQDGSFNPPHIKLIRKGMRYQNKRSTEIELPVWLKCRKSKGDIPGSETVQLSRKGFEKFSFVFYFFSKDVKVRAQLLGIDFQLFQLLTQVRSLRKYCHLRTNLLLLATVFHPLLRMTIEQCYSTQEIIGPRLSAFRCFKSFESMA